MIKEYNFFCEGFWRNLGRYLSDDIRFTKNRWVGKGRKYFNKASKYIDSHGIERNNENLSSIGKYLMGDDLSVASRHTADIDNYISRMDSWRRSRTDLGNDIRDISGRTWDGVRDFSGRTWERIKDAFRSDPATLRNHTVGDIRDYAPLAAAGLGTLGFTTLANDPNVKIGYSNDKKRIVAKNQKHS